MSPGATVRVLAVVCCTSGFCTGWCCFSYLSRIAVHPLQHESDQHATDDQRDQEEEDRFGAKVFALKLGFLILPVEMDVRIHSYITRCS